MMRVESQQVAIRYLKTTDAAPLFENYLGDEQACRFLNRQVHQNVNQTLEAIERWRAQYDQKSPNLLVFAIEELTSQTPIGCLVLIPEQDSSEIHFGISARYQGKGYATQACKLGVVYLQSLGITRIRTAPAYWQPRENSCVGEMWLYQPRHFKSACGFSCFRT